MNQKKRAPLTPAAHCLIDRGAAGAFDASVVRKNGAPAFSTATAIDAVTYTKEPYRAQMYYRDGKTPFPGITIMTTGWDENGGRFRGQWLYPSPSIDEVIRGGGGPQAVLAQQNTSMLFNTVIMFGDFDGPIDLFGMNFTVLDPQWKTLKYRVDKGFDAWWKTDAPGEAEPVE